ncbi:hypothetical protein LU631_14820 [Erwinia tracheiphila]|uniref:XRE family transcriptional regulator n=1 Tax=Erwinia tracheiphila TaxID=65700 RepID=A0A0M2KCA4_9GAMM|nr:hypothetical protein [Erwinia tracheiphila]EOS96951.1 hypothetical protein ETR_00020 [Erwinia tracheiphila PSU-1]KKF34626.1 hypothetical protein SY86_02870 [Erwinia tracheiphila]UIA86299.1 hypothetical protein LU631_14820 [Erwinia tracheiphila]UIA94616.1 hypothetical protein LU633_13030 [Erwinia tracheiphila]
MSNNLNSNGYPEEMAEDIDLQRAERIKKAILGKFTYERMEELSGINIGTLKRIANAQRDAKISELEKIAEITQTDIFELIFGSSNSDIYDSSKRFFETRSKDAAQAAHFIIYNLRTLDDEDILCLGRVSSALQTATTSRKWDELFGKKKG